MKFVLILLITINLLYAVPPCKYENQKVCMYLYKGPLSAEIILINLSGKEVIIKYANAMLAGKYNTVNDTILQSGQRITMLSKRYESYDQNLNEPYHYIGTLSYKTIEKEPQKPNNTASESTERKENIKIEMK